MLNLRTITRRASSLALASTLLASALGPAPAPSLAADLQPAARLNVIMKSVKILDANEGRFDDDGEFKLDFRLIRCNEGVPAPCLGPNQNHVGESEEISGLQETFGAEDDELKPLVRILAPEPGFDVFPGRQYVIRFEMWERDTVDDDYMGRHLHVVDGGAAGLGLGEHTVRASSKNGSHDGDFEVTYEIVQTGQPDLQPVGIKVEDIQGSAQKNVCMTVKNGGTLGAGPYGATLAVNGNVTSNSGASSNGLDAGKSEDLCVKVDLPVSGDHELKALVDTSAKVPESNESNNAFSQPYTVAVKQTTDLTVSSIKINGREPDGKDDCKNGKNNVAVVVKNTGQANAGAFTVALDSGQGSPLEASVAGLDAGQEREVVFDNVRLKKGNQTLKATADSENTVTESNETNNDREVTAQCKND